MNKRKEKFLEIEKLNWAGKGYSPVVRNNTTAHVEKVYVFFDSLLKRFLSEPSSAATSYFFLLVFGRAG